jgi:hypothetical protein
MSNQNVPGNAKRLGMTSISLLENIMVYILIFALFILAIGIISIFYIFPCLREKIAIIIMENYNNMKWNGVLRSISISFLKLCVGLSI